MKNGKEESNHLGTISTERSKTVRKRSRDAPQSLWMWIEKKSTPLYDPMICILSSVKPENIKGLETIATMTAGIPKAVENAESTRRTKVINDFIAVLENFAEKY